MNRIQRIQQMEAAYERLLSGAGTPADRQMLEDWYASPLWLEDIDADQRGEIPSSLSRAVLSEDALYDLLSQESSPYF